MATSWRKVRPSNYGSKLRVGEDDAPELNGQNIWRGTNDFDTIYVRKLFILEDLFSYDTDHDVSALSASRFGTTDLQDFRLKSSNTTRIQITSAGVIALASANLISAVSGTSSQASDIFDRADENPAAGWTTLLGVALYVSSNRAQISGTAGGRLESYWNSSVWANDMVVQADYGALGSGASGVQAGVTARCASAGSNGVTWFARGDPGAPGTGLYLQSPVGTSIITSSVAFGTIAGAHTLKLITSGVSAIGFFDGVFALSGAVTDFAGGMGLYGNSQGGGVASAEFYFDNFLVSAYPSSRFVSAAPEDLVWQASAAEWVTNGTNTFTKQIVHYDNQLVLGIEGGVLVSASYFQIGAGTSAAGTFQTVSASPPIVVTTTGSLSYLRLSAFTSANLPAASSTRDGMMIVDLTASALVIYANGARLSAGFAAF